MIASRTLARLENQLVTRRYPALPGVGDLVVFRISYPALPGATRRWGLGRLQNQLSGATRRYPALGTWSFAESVTRRYPALPGVGDLVELFRSRPLLLDALISMPDSD